MTPNEFKALKGKRKISTLTCYDYSFAQALDSAGIDAILVGDSMAMVLLGHPDTKSIGLREMLEHTKAVCRGAKSTLVIADMPIGTYEDSRAAMQNASLFMQAGAHAVKIEGAKSEEARALVAADIPVMGHLGLLPQTAQDYKVQGKTPEAAEKLLREAKALDDAGVFAIVLECVPASLAEKITESVSVPTIGIGAGPDCDGQILVLYDLLGLYGDAAPKFVKVYADLREQTALAVRRYKNEVEGGVFPDESHSYK
ncbi:MAG: 3-methyl-2-oxobutanoate hydroxymethyltransferase [Candidatus Micrarchaeia archaeon]|jgi:3-methyl-2-oxobutanoate hydroxymethyltransferase